MQNLLLKAANSEKHLEEHNIICKIYKDDLDAYSLQAQLKLLEFLKASNLSLSELINSFRALPASKQAILAEAFELIKLILVAPTLQMPFLSEVFLH